MWRSRAAPLTNQRSTTPHECAHIVQFHMGILSNPIIHLQYSEAKPRLPSQTRRSPEVANVTAISVERVGRSRVGDVDLATVAFSRVFSDHMFSAECHHGQWSAAPKLTLWADHPGAERQCSALRRVGFRGLEGSSQYADRRAAPVPCRGECQTAATFRGPTRDDVTAEVSPPRRLAQAHPDRPILGAAGRRGRAVCPPDTLLHRPRRSCQAGGALSLSDLHLSLRRVLLRAGRCRGDGAFRFRLPGRHRRHQAGRQLRRQPGRGGGGALHRVPFGNVAGWSPSTGTSRNAAS